MPNNTEGQLVDMWNKEEESTGLKGWMEENVSKKGAERLVSNIKESSVSDKAHIALGSAGMVPGVGFIADILDAGLYGIEGDKLGVGLSLLSAIPVLGLVSGAGKLGKAAKIAKAQKQQTSMVEGVQKVIKSFGGDPNDAKLVSELTDEFAKTANNLVESQHKFERFWKDLGVHKIDKLADPEEWANLPEAFQKLGGVPRVDFEDALAVFHYRDSLTPAAKAAQKQYREVVGESAEEIADWKDMMERAFEFMDRVAVPTHGRGAEAWVKWMDELDFGHEIRKTVGKPRS